MRLTNISSWFEALSILSIFTYLRQINEKLEKYSILIQNRYNMDEKGFLIGCINETKRVVPLSHYKEKKLAGAAQDGNRGWVTFIGGICCDGTYLPPGLIFQGQGNIQESWVAEFEASKYSCYFASTPTGWTNEDIGYEWLTKIFDRHTKAKARQGRDWRLLWADGHNSHLNLRFLDWCYQNKILVAIYPPHATHRLQPLDVSLFSPLSTRYSQGVDAWLRKTRGLVGLSQQDVFGIFWPAFISSFTEQNILKAWLKTGLFPWNPEIVLKVLDRHQESPDRPLTTSSSPLRLTPSNWRGMRAELRTEENPLVRKLIRGFSRVAAQNSILEHRINLLEQGMAIQKRHQQRSKPLFDQMRADNDCKTLFFSPTKIQQAHTMLQEKEEVEQREAKAKQQRAINRELKKEQKKREQLERKIERERAQRERGAKKAAEQAQKQVAKDARAAQKQLILEAKIAKKRASRKPKQPTRSNHKNKAATGVIEGRVAKRAIERPRRNIQPPQRFVQ